MNNSKILLVDDEQDILNLLKITLNKEGFTNIYFATCGKEAIEICSTKDIDLIVLDIILPDMLGFDVCIKLRDITVAPILFLTAKTSDLDKLSGFSIGGDDYITKPFNPLEVAARIKAQLNRKNVNSMLNTKNVFDFGCFKLIEQSAQLFVNSTEIDCPAKEFQLLLFFCKYPNRIFSRDQLYEQVWGEESISDDNTVMVHIRRIREKIEKDPSHPEYLVNVRGLGYKLLVK